MPVRIRAGVFVIQFAINLVMAIEEDTLQLGILYDERRY
jgi:hypothetical protein